MIALYDPITPMIQLGLWLLGLIILVAIGLGWRCRQRGAANQPEEFGEDLHELADRKRSERDEGPNPNA